MSAVPFTLAVPFVFALTRFRELPSFARVIALLLLLSGVSQLVVIFLANAGVNNLPVFHAYTLVEVLLLLWFFHHLPDAATATNYLYIIGGIFLVFTLLNTLFIQNLFHFNSYSRSIEALLVLFLCLGYFGRQLLEDRLSFKQAGLWFVIGLFIYFSSSFALFVVSNLSLALDKYFDWIMWNIHATMLLIMYTCFTIGFMKCHR